MYQKLRREKKKQRQNLELQAIEIARGHRDTNIYAEMTKLLGPNIPQEKLRQIKQLIESDYRETVIIVGDDGKEHVMNAVWSGNGVHASQKLVTDTVIDVMSKNKYKPTKKKKKKVVFTTKRGAEGLQIMAPMKETQKRALLEDSNKAIKSISNKIDTLKKHILVLDEHFDGNDNSITFADPQKYQLTKLLDSFLFILNEDRSGRVKDKRDRFYTILNKDGGHQLVKEKYLKGKEDLVTLEKEREREVSVRDKILERIGNVVENDNEDDIIVLDGGDDDNEE